MNYKPEHLDPNPRIEPEAMTGAQMSVPLAWLTGHMIDSLVVDGSHLISVDTRAEVHDGLLHVTCTDEEGSSHLFEYDPTDRDTPVRHVIIDKPQAG